MSSSKGFGKQAALSLYESKLSTGMPQPTFRCSFAAP